MACLRSVRRWYPILAGVLAAALSVSCGGGGGGTGTVSAPVFSPDPGRYSLAKSVTISTTTPGAAIRYTTDGTTPTDNTGTVYSGAISVSSTTTIKAVAYLAGWDPSSVSTAAYTIAGPYAYVTNQDDNTVSVLDASAGTVVATIRVGGAPLGVAVNPSGTRVYVNNNADNTVSVIDADTRSVVATVPVGHASHGVTLDNAGTRAYVSNWGDSTVTVIDTATDCVIATVGVGASPSAVAIAPDGTKAYVANYDGGSYSIIDTTGWTVQTVLFTSDHVASAAVSPDGTKAYVSTVYSGVWVVDTATGSVIDSIPSGGQMSGGGTMAFSPDGSRLYLACFGNGISGSDHVAVIDTATKAVSVITAGSRPTGIALDSTGAKGYVVNYGGNSVSVIDTATSAVTGTIGVGGHPWAVSIEPYR